MATIKYYLKRKNAPERTSIQLYLMFGNKIIKIATKESIHPKYWDFDKQEVKRNYAGASELNEFLKDFSNKVIKCYRELRNQDKEISTGSIKLKLYPDIIVKLSIWDYYNEFISFKKKECSPNTIKKYISLLNHLKTYQKKYEKLSIDKIDLSFYEKFTHFMYESEGLTNNTVGKYIQGLKTFLAWGFDKQYHQNRDFTKFKKITEKTEIIYLTEKELDILAQHSQPISSKLGKVRDIFLFGCYTGQRFSDISNLKREDLKDEVWFLRVQKTRDILEIPLLPQAQEILSRYSEVHRPLPSISNQKMNEYLKELGKAVGLNTPMTINRYRGNERISITKPKYDFITSHTARRTFVTLSLEKGMRPETIMEITGHQDYSMLKKYIKITSKVKQNELLDKWK